MRLLAIGDIHGCYDALRALEAAVPILPTDMVITLGDYVNRGPQSAAVLEWLIARHATGQLIPLRGNHEIMMLEAKNGGGSLVDFLSVGGDKTLLSAMPCRCAMSRRTTGIFWRARCGRITKRRRISLSTPTRIPITRWRNSRT